jgi:hypothetical protein
MTTVIESSPLPAQLLPAELLDPATIDLYSDKPDNQLWQEKRVGAYIDYGIATRSVGHIDRAMEMLEGIYGSASSFEQTGGLDALHIYMGAFRARAQDRPIQRLGRGGGIISGLSAEP